MFFCIYLAKSSSFSNIDRNKVLFNITNSVNFPEVSLARATDYRLSIVNANLPDMVGQISHILGENDINIHHMVNESRNGLAYTLMDLDRPIFDDVIDRIKQIKGVLTVRVI